MFLARSVFLTKVHFCMLNMCMWIFSLIIIFLCMYVCREAHQGRVTVVLFVLEMEWVLSTGQDRTFAWHCSESGQRLGGYRTTAWVSGLQYPKNHGDSNRWLYLQPHAAISSCFNLVVKFESNRRSPTIQPAVLCLATAKQYSP